MSPHALSVFNADCMLTSWRPLLAQAWDMGAVMLTQMGLLGLIGPTPALACGKVGPIP